MLSAGTLHAGFRALPLAGLDRIAPGTALVLAPHADDESLGCGGLIAEACRLGRPPLVVVATDGVGSHPGSVSWPPARLREQRERETRAAVSRLGLSPDRVHFLRLPDTAAPSEGPAFEQAVGTLSALSRQAGCSTLLAPWRHDPHCDHLAAWRMAEALSRRDGLSLLSYPVWGWTLPDDVLLDEPEPDGFRLDISAHRDAKQAAIAAHETQYGGLIDDDPAGFRLPETLLSAFAVPWEVFLRPAHPEAGR